MNDDILGHDQHSGGNCDSDINSDEEEVKWDEEEKQSEYSEDSEEETFVG
jgi:hypothetical protein